MSRKKHKEKKRKKEEKRNCKLAKLNGPLNISIKVKPPPVSYLVISYPYLSIIFLFLFFLFSLTFNCVWFCKYFKLSREFNFSRNMKMNFSKMTFTLYYTYKKFPIVKVPYSLKNVIFAFTINYFYSFLYPVIPIYYF